MATRWVFMVVDEKIIQKTIGKERVKKDKGIQIHPSNDAIVAQKHKQSTKRHVQVCRLEI
jgi:hypothetical protein